VDEVIGSYNRVESKVWSFPYAWMPNLTVDEIPRYYTEHENTFGSTRCICPWSVVDILPNGDVATCVDIPDYVAGNIRENGIMEIWNNERYKRFRAVVKEEGHLPACTRCSGLIGRGL
jgi:radical SAM protein with 4Fe4S-binding SPASM domain